MRKKRVLAVLLSLTMLVSMLPNAWAAETGGVSDVGRADGREWITPAFTDSIDLSGVDDVIELEGGSWTLTERKEVSLGTNDSLYSPTDMVRVIVVMEDEPLLKYAQAARMDMPAYLATADAAKIESNLYLRHADTQAAIQALDPSVSDIRYEYTAVLNGFSLEMPYGLIEDAARLPGVKRISVVEYYSLPDEEVSYDLQMAYSTGMIGSSAVNEMEFEGADGAGAVVAILDSGLDTDHEAFMTMPEKVAYEQEDVQKLMSGAKLSSGITKAEDTYVNEKVPYAYDYANQDTNVNGDIDHGTHVAGTVAGNNGKDFFGVAPNAQLMIMKIFSDGQQSTADDIITAGLDDAVKLGADSINMSLGSPAGFSYDRETEDEVYNNCWDAGINLMIAAGNETSSSYMNQYGNSLPLADTVDNSIVGNPSTSYTAMSVASVDNTVAQSYYFVANDTESIGFQVMVNAQTSQPQNIWYQFRGNNYTDPSVTWDLAVISGYGAEKDYTADQADLTDKVALIQRGGTDENGESLTFEEKARIAVEVHHAVGVIIYNNESGAFAPAFNTFHGAMVGISKADGEKLIELAKEGTVKVTFGPLLDTDYPYNTPQEQKIPWIALLPSETSGRISSFSSIGPAPDLALKPEISAPGGTITSSMIGGGYGVMSGTSMATPHMAGAAALVRNYVRSQLKDQLKKEDNDVDVRNITEALLMSTAVPAKNENGVEQSPRWQGAGVVNVKNAATSAGYLTVDQADGVVRPKAELGWNEDGKFSFEFKVHNVTDTDVTYTLEAVSLTEDVLSQNNVDFANGVSRRLEEGDFTVTYSGAGVTDGKVKVSANSTTTVKVELELTKKYIDELTRKFPNGGYVEGYLYLQPTEGVTLTLPYLGFCGNWLDAGVVFEDGPESDWLLQPTLFATSNDSGQGVYLAANMYHEEGVPDYNYDRLAFSPSIGTVPQHLAVLLSTRRNLTDFSMTVQDPDNEDEVIWGLEAPYLRKTYAYYTGVGYAYTTTQVIVDGWNGHYFDEEAEAFSGPLAKSKVYNFVLEGNVGQTEDGYTKKVFPFYLDEQDPVIENVETYLDKDGKFMLAFDLTDDHFINMIQIDDSTGRYGLTYANRVSEDGLTFASERIKQGATHKVILDLDGLCDFLAANGLNPGRIHVYGIDYAMNEGGLYIDLGPQYMSLANMTIAQGDSQQAALRVRPARLEDTLDLTWTSANENIATVDQSGLVTGVKKGETTITVKTGNGLSASCHVTVGDETLPPEEPEMPNDSAPVNKPKPEAFPAVWDTRVEASDSDSLGETFQDEDSGIWYKITGAGTVQLIANPDAPDYGSGYPELPAELTIPETVSYDGRKYTVTTIGYKAFASASQLTKVTLPDTIRVVGDSAFYMCSNLMEINLPEGLEEVDHWGFYFVPADLELPESLRYIGEEAFNFSGITQVRFGDAIENVGKRAFGFCKSLTTAELPLAAQEAEGLYMSCDKLEDVSFAPGLTYIPENCFYGDAALTEVDIPEGVTEIGKSAFYMTGLTSIDLPSTVTTLGDFAYAGLDNCTDFVIPDSVTYVGSNIFYWSKYVRSITIGANVAYIGNGFNTFFIHPDVPETGIVPEVRSATAGAALRRSGFMGQMTKDGLPFDVYTGAPFVVDGIDYMPISATEAMITGYEQGEVPPVIYIPEQVTCEGDETTYTVTAVADRVFSQNYGVLEIHLPDTITTVGERAFDQMHGLEYLNIPKGLTTITGLQAFGYGGWDNLEWSGKWAPMTLEVPAGLTTWNQSAFSGNHYTSIVLADGLEMVGEYGICYNKAVESVSFPASLKYIKKQGLTGMEKLTHVELPEGLLYIGDQAFQNDPLESVTLPDSLQYIGAQAFESIFVDYDTPYPYEKTYTGVEELTIPGGVIGMGWNAIYKDVDVTVTLASQRNLVVERNNLTEAPSVVWDGRTDIPEGDYSVIPAGVTVTVAGDVTVDGKLYVNGTLEITGHIVAEDDERIVVSESGKVDGEENIVDHIHEPVSRGAVPATCTQSGYTGDTYCSICGQLLSGGTVIPAYGHNYGEWTVEREPSLNVAGVEKRTCSRCGAIERREFGAAIQAKEFADVPAGAWFYDAVQRMAEEGLMNGVSDTAFAPDDHLRRGDLAVILYRMAASPAVELDGSFTDVASDQYYAAAIAWAKANGVIEGYDGGVFGPEDDITRQQLAVILYRYAKLTGCDMSAESGVTAAYSDAAEIGSWAEEAMDWAVSAGIIQGRGGKRLAPGDTATRAEIAVMLVRFLDKAAPADGGRTA